MSGAHMPQGAESAVETIGGRFLRGLSSFARGNRSCIASGGETDQVTGRLMTSHSMPRTASEPSLAAWLHSFCQTASMDRLSAILATDRELCRVLEAVEEKHRLDQDAALETEKGARAKVSTTRWILSDSKRAARMPRRHVGRGLFGDGAVLPSRRFA